MYGRGQRIQPIQQGTGRRVQEFVVDAIDPALAPGFGLLPAVPGDDLFEWHAIAGAAPGGDDYVRISAADLLYGDLPARLAEESSAGDFDQLRDPALREDQRLAPFF